MRHPRLLSPVLVGIALSLPGCGGVAAPVGGTVVLNGKEVEYTPGSTLTLTFTDPQAKPPRAYRAMLGGGPGFSVMNPENPAGIPPGTYKITALLTGAGKDAKRDALNKRYNAENTPLSVTVPPAGLKAVRVDLDAGTVTP